MALVSTVTIYFPSMTGSCILGMVGFYKVYNLISAFNTLSYAGVSVLASFLWYINSDDFYFSFGLTLYTSSRISCTGILSYGLSYGSVVGFLSSSIPGTTYSSCVLRNIFMVYSGSVIFYSSH